jgi:predicted transcriptional regulator
MPRTSQHAKDTSFTLRLDPELKAAFTAVTEAEDRPVAQVIRDFMRAYIKRRERLAFETEARRQSKPLAAAGRDPSSPQAEELRWLEAFVDQDDFGDEWKS